MTPMRTLQDIADFTKTSESYWKKRSAAGLLFCTKVGRKIRFTEEQWEQTLALFAVEPKHTPTRDELAARRAAAITSTRKAAR